MLIFLAIQFTTNIFLPSFPCLFLSSIFYLFLSSLSIHLPYTYFYPLYLSILLHSTYLFFNTIPFFLLPTFEKHCSMCVFLSQALTFYLHALASAGILTATCSSFAPLCISLVPQDVADLTARTLHTGMDWNGKKFFSKKYKK